MRLAGAVSGSLLTVFGPQCSSVVVPDKFISFTITLLLKGYSILA